jgi:MFS family permease
VGALRDRRFRRLLVGNSVSSFGNSALYLSLGIWAKDLTGSNAAAGGVFLALGLPYLAAPLAGHLVDRARRRPLLIVTNGLAAGAVLGLLGVHSAAQLWLIYAVAFVYGALSIVIAAAGTGLVKDLLADADLIGANAASATTSQGLRIASPLVGAAIYSQLGGDILALFDVATFVAAIVALLSVRIEEHPPDPGERGRLRVELLAGAAQLIRTPLLAQVTRSASLAMLVLGFYESVTFAVIAAIGRPPSFFGVLMSVQAAGSIAGGLAVGRIARHFGEARTLGIALLAWALASLIYLVPNLPADLVAITIFGTAVPLYAVAVTTATQRYTPSHLQGRANVASNTATSLAQTLSIAIGASLVDTIGYQPLLGVVALVTILAALPVILHPAAAPEPIDVSK